MEAKGRNGIEMKRWEVKRRGWEESEAKGEKESEGKGKERKGSRGGNGGIEEGQGSEENEKEGRT